MWKNAILLDKGIDFSGFKSFDPRLNAPFITGTDNSDTKILLQWVDQIEIEQDRLDYFTPNNVSLLFSLAEKAGIAATNLLANIKKRASARDYGSTYDRKVLISDSILVCDYLEQIQTAVVFSFTAIEAFVNISIPHDYKYEISTGRKTEIYDKEQIERWISWKDKLSKILVNIYRTPKIEDQKFWPRFLKLVEQRNSIIHQKSSNDTKYMESLFCDEIFEICCSANEIFSFFLANSLERLSKNTEMIGSEYRWSSVITYVPNLELKHGTIRNSD